MRAGVELAQPEADRQDVPDGGVHVGFGEQAAVQGLAQGPERRLLVLGEAVHPGAQGGGEPGGVVAQVVLVAGQVGAGPGVADDQHVVAGPGAQLVVDQRAQVGGPAVHEVVGGHHRHRRARGDRRPEGR
jgi:hypothetical protein